MISPNYLAELPGELLAELFGLALVRLARARDAPGIVFLLGLGNAVERGLVGFFVHLRLLGVGALVTALMVPTTAAHLRLCGRGNEHDHCRHREPASHCSPPCFWTGRLYRAR